MAAEIVHGGINYGEFERLGIDPATVIDFSVNGNPYGPSPAVRDALLHADIAHYPDRHCLHLRRAIREYELFDTDLPLDAILCGNGTAELIWAIARAFLQPGDTAAIIGPTFGEYAAACHAVRADIIDGGAELFETQPDLVWLCNPNNPTGHYREEADLWQIVQACQTSGATLVVDEAYWHFLSVNAPGSATTLLDREDAPDIIVLRSLTKDYALAGLRLGYLVAKPDTVARIAAQLPSWNVSAPAQAAGIAALADQTHLRQTLAMLADERRDFFAALCGTGLTVVPSDTHFCLVGVGDAPTIRQQLLAKGLLVRDCTSFGLPQYIRVATRPRADWERLIAALYEVREP